MRYLMKQFGPILGILLFAAIIIGTALSPSSCASSDSSDRELSFAQAGLSAARIAYSIAQAELTAKLADPTTPPLERQLATVAAKEAGDALAKEQARVDKLIADRAAAKLAAAQAAADKEAAASLPEGTLTPASTPPGPVNPLLPAPPKE